MAWFRCGEGGETSGGNSPRLVDMQLDNAVTSTRSAMPAHSFSVEPGDIILIGVMYDAASLNTPEGYTKIKTTPEYNGTWTAMFYKKITASGTESVTITQSATRHLQGIFLQLRGVSDVEDALIDDYATSGTANLQLAMTNRPLVLFLSSGSLKTWSVAPLYCVIPKTNGTSQYIDVLLNFGTMVNGNYTFTTSANGWALCGVYLTQA